MFPHLDWALLGDDVFKAVKDFEAEATIVIATRAPAPSAKKNVGQKLGVSEVITDPLPPEHKAPIITPTDMVKMPPSDEIKDVELIEEMHDADLVQDPPAA